MSRKALIVTPYLDHLGGGERYMLEAASAIESAGYELYFAWDNLAQITKLTNLLNIKLVNPQLDSNILPLYSQSNPVKMYQLTHQYDLVLYLSDGSIPLLGSKKNIIHIQVPFHGVGGRKLTTQLKLKSISEIIVNSVFTKSVIDKEFHTNSHVVYPPISLMKKGKKENLILSVGRFEPTLNIKRQDILIKAFRKLSPSSPGWRLALVGGSSDNNYLAKLKKMAGNLPIDFYPNAKYEKLTKLYQQSSLYWHAAGYEVNASKHPEQVEHFGITTAEAITAGCIPLVVPKGGQVEILPSQDYHWNTINELVALSKRAFSGELAIPNLPDRFLHSNFRQSILDII